jgi:hypothetical protein
MGKGHSSLVRDRDMEDITPERFKCGLGSYAAIFRLPDGRYAVRGELIHSFRSGDTPEGTVIVDLEMLKDALELYTFDEALGMSSGMSNG